MSLSMLTTSGWVLFALATVNLLTFSARLAMRAPGKYLGNQALFLGVAAVWLTWLMTP